MGRAMSTMSTTHPSSGMREHAAFVGLLIKNTATSYSANEGYRLGAAFSYYATFSIFPLLLLAVTVVGFVVGDSAPARDRLLDAITTPGSPIRDVLAHTLGSMQAQQNVRGVSALVGLATLLFAASGAFVELDAALNRIWHVPARRYEGIVGTIRGYAVERLSGFAIVAGFGLTLLVSLVSSSVLGAIVATMEARISMSLWPAFARTASVLLSMTILTAVFTAAFHFIPRSRPPVKVVFGGALLTTTFLSMLKETFASYLSHLTHYSAYGVVGGVLGLATWIYLSSQIILMGAQLTRVYAEAMGEVPSANAQLRSGCATSAS
jgi:membrane protein